MTPQLPCRLTYEPYGKEDEDGAPPMHMLHNPYAGNGKPVMQRQPPPAVAIGGTSAPAFTPDKAQVCLHTAVSASPTLLLQECRVYGCLALHLTSVSTGQRLGPCGSTSCCKLGPVAGVTCTT